jgi:RelB antitoxin
MPATEMVHIRINKRVKAQATKALSAMGLSVSERSQGLADPRGRGEGFAF